jgi:DNA-binding transcriptional MerR regulator
MADTTSAQGYLSIGEVLGLLLEEFPDVTISKIRFLESQGLISPERTASGYRKFYDDDVELLRVILTEQRENFLPLRVIKTRLENGEIDPTGEHNRPDDDGTDGTDDPQAGSADDADPTPQDVPASAVRSHPASRGQSADAGRRIPSTDTEPTAPPAAAPHAASSGSSGPTHHTDEAPPSAAQLLPGVLLDRGELCSMVGMTDAELAQLESFGVVQPQAGSSGIPVYGDDAVEIAGPACAFLRAGIDARHLRNFRTSAEREASLYEQIVTPRYRQRNPEARAEALAQLRQLDALGAKLRSAMTKHALGHHFRS